MKEFGFPTTGDPDKDAEIAAGFRRWEALQSEGLCPNGCAPLVQVDAQTRRCGACGFIGQTFNLYVGEISDA